MSRVGLEVRARPRWWRPHRSVPLDLESVQQALERLVGDVGDLRTPGVDEWAWYGKHATGDVGVVRDAAGRVVAVTGSISGHSPTDDRGNRDDAVAVVMPLLELAEATGAVLDSSYGVVIRATLDEVIDAI